MDTDKKSRDMLAFQTDENVEEAGGF